MNNVFSYIQPEHLRYLQCHLETMSTDMNKTTNTFVVFRSVVLSSGMHPPHVPAPVIRGILVTLRPGFPPDYPPPLPRGTIIWAASDGSSAIDPSSGYYTVRPYAEVLAESRLSAVRTVRLYAHGQASESFVANVVTGQKRGRSMAALACRREAELSELQTPVKRKVSTANPSREARKPGTLAYPRALSNQMKLLGRAFLPWAAVITAYHQVSCVSIEPDTTQYIFVSTTEEDDRMFVPEDDMQSIIEEMEISPGTITAIWAPPPLAEHVIHDTEMKSPRQKKFGKALRAFSALFNKRSNVGLKTPFSRFMLRKAASKRGIQAEVVMRGYRSDAQAGSPQTPNNFLEFARPAYRSPTLVARPVVPCPRKAGQLPSLSESWTECSLNETIGRARQRGVGDAKRDTGKKWRVQHLRRYRAPKSSRLEKAKTSAKRSATSSRPDAADFFDPMPLLREPISLPPAPLRGVLPPRTTFQEVYGNTLSFPIAPAEDITTKLRERAEAFFGHLGDVFGAPRLPAFDMNAFFNRGGQGIVKETHHEVTQPPHERSELSLEELFQTMGVAEAPPDLSEQQSPKNLVLSSSIRTLCPSPGTPTKQSRNKGAGHLIIDQSSDEEEDGPAGSASRPGSLLDILGGVTRNLGFLRLQ
ncbi:hypothetical protein H4582DRAFT_1945573 [Lactarius indigo]|nr:hypothetical protein H4582DRAFT_1945573 [Lactarius indigo]